MALTFIVFILIAYYVGKNSTKQREFEERRKREIAHEQLQSAFDDELKKAKSKQERDVLNRLKTTAASILGFGTAGDVARILPDTTEVVPPEPAHERPIEAVAQDSKPQEVIEITPPQEVVESPRTSTDSTSTLLYFGAFLFITSVGLFVAFADVTGSIRTLLVMAVMLILYSVGMWLWSSTERLKDVGLTFMGIGMAIVPLVGVALYVYAFDRTNGPVIWFVTSLFALCLYLFTLVSVRAVFVSYMLIASIVSLTQAAVGVIDVPIYYFAWMFALVGLGFRLMSLGSSTTLPGLKDASGQSAQLMVPLTILASLFLVEQEGVGQLSISLLIGSIFYAVEAVAASQESTRQSYITTSHVLVVASLCGLAYAYDSSLQDVSIALLAISAIHIAAFAVWSKPIQSLATALLPGALAAAVFGLFVSLSFADLLTASLVATTLLSLVITLRTQSTEILALGLLTWLSLPFVVGQLLLSDRLSYGQQAWMSLVAVLPLLIAASGQWLTKKSARLFDVVSSAAVLGMAAAIFTAGIAGMESIFAVSVVSVLLLLVLSELNKTVKWQSVALFFTIVPAAYALVLTLSDEQLVPYLTLSLVWSLVVCIGVALRYRHESARWLSSGVWLLLPYALGKESIGPFSLEISQQMWLYVVVTATLLVSRAIARGHFLSVANVPLASLTKTSSQSYLGAASVASFVAVVLAFQSSQDVTGAVVLAVLCVLWTCHGIYIEREKEYLALVPIGFQAVLVRLFEPYQYSLNNVSINEQELVLFVGLSSLTALVLYGVFRYALVAKKIPDVVLSLSVGLLFVAPATVLFSEETIWIMPLTLGVAGLVLLFHTWQKPQAIREWSGAVLLLSVLWTMRYLGIEELQAYTHVIALFFGIYAYWRTVISDVKNADAYLWALLTTATVPLTLQALEGQSGDIYGVLLLLQQVAILLLGVVIQKRFVVRWGLFVAIGTVLYQLRDLGWAMLTVLSLVIIGFAIARALRESDNSDK